MNRSIWVGAFEMNCKAGHVIENLKLAEAWVIQAARQGAHSWFCFQSSCPAGISLLRIYGIAPSRFMGAPSYQANLNRKQRALSVYKGDR